MYEPNLTVTVDKRRYEQLLVDLEVSRRHEEQLMQFIAEKEMLQVKPIYFCQKCSAEIIKDEN